MLSKGQDQIPDTIDLYPVTIISLHSQARDAETLDLKRADFMAHDGGALLKQIPAISTIQKSGSYGFDPVFRGFKYEQLNVVLDGVQSASAACPNRMDPPTSQMAPNMIKRVELLKGPHALRYGNSFGATLHYIPHAPEFSEKAVVYGRLSGGYESNGRVLRSEGLAGLRTKNIDLGLFSSWSEGQDYRDGEDFLIPASFRRGSFGLQLAVKLSEKQILKTSATRNMARDAEFAALPMDLRDDDTWLLNLNHKIYFSAGKLRSLNSSLYASLVNHLMDNLTKTLDPRMVNATTRALTRNMGGRSEASWNFRQSRLYSGLDFRLESAEGTRIREFLMGPQTGGEAEDNIWQGGRIVRGSAFAEYHLRRAGIKWVLSGRMELNRAELMDADPLFETLYENTSKTQINPAFSLGGSKSFGTHFNLALWLGRTHRSPGLTERYINYFPVGQDPYEMLGNPDLKPEINNEIDIQLKGVFEKSQLNLDLFAAYMQDLISSRIDSSQSPRLPSSPGVRSYVNLDQALKLGLEAGWVRDLPAGLHLQIHLAYTYAQDLVRQEALPEIAPLDFRCQLSGRYFKERLQPYLHFRHVLEQKRISVEYGESPTPSFSLVDLGFSFRLSKAFGFSAALNNLFDAAYYEHLSRAVRGSEERAIYAPGRSFLLSFLLDFM